MQNSLNARNAMALLVTLAMSVCARIIVSRAERGKEELGGRERGREGQFQDCQVDNVLQ